MIDVVHELVEDALRELADEAYQRELWLASAGPEVSSFAECVERLFTDSGLTIALDGHHIAYSVLIDDRLTELRALLRRIDDTRAPEEILRDARLRGARSLAQGLLQELRDFGSNRDDR